MTTFELPVDRRILYCPRCDRQHIDRGEWATLPHKTHRCEHCLHEWRPSNDFTVGVAYGEVFQTETQVGCEAEDELTG